MSLRSECSKARPRAGFRRHNAGKTTQGRASEQQERYRGCPWAPRPPATSIRPVRFKVHSRKLTISSPSSSTNQGVRMFIMMPPRIKCLLSLTWLSATCSSPTLLL